MDNYAIPLATNLRKTPSNPLSALQLIMACPSPSLTKTMHNFPAARVGLFTATPRSFPKSNATAGFPLQSLTRGSTTKSRF
ncbi:hypothetical protein [Chryseobacterium koreense]|uniref:Uncharacterized protein n=1 Tax=Chryseobacterium koreense CCUG 49689 TaxID=1304281 RepID=A0A0J7J3U7_9FLAO|nr:hypothetical protein [Chryseobacterium koreense]KMQ72684.1 hypothetical protein ACM44_00910 [Chryseobacterium koreense CCUG 49689]